jgi:tRNA A-37 threonylcarbamoyl transferase component Bud32
MDLDRWRRLEEIYHAVLEKEPSGVRSFLDDACGADQELRREIEALLAQEAAQGPMDRPLWNGPSPLQPRTAFAAGTMAGRYRILRLIGEGGMGAVYEAEQDKPRRTVALKVIKPGLARSEVLRRFEQEAQALGRLQHAGIAQIYEAGTADTGFGPQPYFAMEFIQGESLGQYAEAHGLSTNERLGLMAEVCDAVHHAHQRGLIHRDLKPGNILVDANGHPKVLDFGVARVTDGGQQATRQTDIGQLVGTLAYMSPEQVQADPLEVDTRSDVYALGVILYELLAGRPPYTLSAKLHEAAHTICEEDPARLSSINRSLRGDIETIVAKALEKGKGRRYASAADLAGDIRRFLTHQPIVARPPTASYQLQKFAQRHTALVAGIVAVFVVLLGGVIASTWQAMRANRAGQAAIAERDRAAAAERRAAEERDRANAERNRAVEAEAKMLQERNRAIAERQRADTEAATAKAINEFLQDDVLAQAGASSQARPDTKPDPDLKVRTALERAAKRIEGKFEKQPLVEAAIRQTLSNTYLDLGLYAEAQPHLERALELRRRVLGDQHLDTLELLDEAASLYYRRGQYTQSAPLHAKVLEARLRILGEAHLDTLKSMNNLADSYRAQGKYAEAEPLFKRTLEIKKRVLGPDDPSTLVSMSNLGLLYLNQGQYSRTEPLYTQVVESRRRILGEEHPRTLSSAYSLGALYWYQDKRQQAESLLDKVQEVQRRVLGDSHPDTLRTMDGLGAMYLAQKKYAQGEAILMRTLEARRSVLGEEHPETLNTMRNIAGFYRTQGRYAESEELYIKVLEHWRRAKGAENLDTLLIEQSAGYVMLLEKKYSEAEPLLRTSMAGLAKTNPDGWQRFNSQSMLGASLAGQGKHADSEPLLISAYEGMLQRKASIRSVDRLYLQKAGEWIVQLYQDWQKPDRAAEWRERLQRDGAAESAANR